MNSAPQSLRRHIAIFGRRNVGKSSLLNAITGQQVAIVSPEAGTTTDPVNRAMEILPLGPCMLIDTAGFDDEGNVGELRNQRTHRVLDQADMAILVIDQAHNLSLEKEWLQELHRLEIPAIVVLNKVDKMASSATLVKAVSEELGLVSSGGSVLLVMPQDPQAPKGRLILPQVQTIRDLLNKNCIAICCGVDNLKAALDALREAPSLIITDSQVFKQVYELKPVNSKLTSFSVLMAGMKGNIDLLLEGARAIDNLTPRSRVLIAEACSHAPMNEDIGRVKIPRLVRKKYGESIVFDIHAGKDYPADLKNYDLIVHCGACMFNRRLMLSRILRAQQQGVPITNYGLALAHLQGILDKVELPKI